MTIASSVQHMVTESEHTFEAAEMATSVGMMAAGHVCGAAKLSAIRGLSVFRDVSISAIVRHGELRAIVMASYLDNWRGIVIERLNGTRILRELPS